MLQIKYPRTVHLPFSRGICPDDIICPVFDATHPLLREEIIITEKLDGGNCSIYRGNVYARTTTNEASHPSFGPVKQLASQIASLVPDEYQLFGENMFGIHSITYDKLSSYFYLFAAFDTKSKQFLPWDSLVSLAESLDVPTVPRRYRGTLGTPKQLENWIKTEMKQKSSCGLSTCPEGFVVRLAKEFDLKQFETSVAKYVREGHVQTDATWKRTWKAAKLTS